MRKTSEREQVRTVAKRWLETYFVDGRWRYNQDGQKEQIYRTLADLDVENATAADVHRLIGNGSWVEPFRCTECGVDAWDAVEVGEEPGYESCTAYMCPRCLRKALELAHG